MVAVDRFGVQSRSGVDVMSHGSAAVVPTESSVLLPNDRALVMGVLNVTPDSFSDGGKFFDVDAAIVRGLELFDGGCDVVDVGGESSRPGALPVSAAEELRRVLPVVAALAEAKRGRVSIDTVKPAVAEAAIDAGATLVNDISAALAPVVASALAAGSPDVGWVAMHMQGSPRSMQADPRYDDVVASVLGVLRQRAEAARELGVDEVWVDPGIGFGKTADHNFALLRHLDRFVALGYPVVVGTSRKRFLGELLARSDAGVRGDPTQERTVELSDAPIDDRLAGSIGTEVWSVMMGARMIRVHDVAAAVHVVTLATSH